MANNNDKPEGGRAASAARARPRGNERPFDMWLHKQLHAMYDEIASEPLPDDLLNLIEKDAAEQKNGSSDEPSEK
ncbi:NepR family anti-sigma factor [Reyranella sp.]|uniref:NepR family anti-sigma factor n=1 Tax=Reyranella sp. TaxID=1929291 RepID=UPI003C7B4B41